MQHTHCTMPKDDPKLNMRLVEIKNIAINAAGVLQPWLPLVYTKLFLRTMRTWVGSALAAELHYKKTTLQKVNPWIQSALFHFHLTLSNLRQPKPCMHGSHIVTNSAGMYAKGAKLLPHFWPEIWNPSRKHIKYLGFLGRKWYTMCPNMCIFGLMWYRRRRWLHAWSASWFMADL